MSSNLQFFHELNVVVDDILSEEDLGFVEGEEPTKDHVPTNRGDHSENIPYPLNCELLQHLVAADDRKLFCHSLKVYQDFEFSSIGVVYELIQDVVVLLLIYWNFLS